jgi:PAS domain S-box-containing protein
MKDEHKSKDQLIRELNDLRQIVSELKACKMEREVAQTALGESENRYKSLVDLSPEAIFVHQEGIILYINPAGINIFGAGSSEELLQKPLLDLVHPDYHDTVKYRLNDIYEEQKTLNRTDLKLIRLDQTEIDVEATGTYISYSGKPAGLSIVRDVTKRKRSEIALNRSEKRYRQLVETMNEGLGLADENYIFTYVNPRFCEMLGYHRSDIVGCKLIDFVHDDYKAVMKDQIARRKKGEEERFELAWKTKGGEIVYTSASPKALYDEQGRFIGSMGILTDITYRKKAEEALRLSEEKYRHLVENANDAIFVLQDGNIKFFNNKAKLIGRELGIELDRIPLDRYIHPKDRDMVIDRHIQRLAGEQLPDTYAFRLLGKDDQEMWVEVNAVRLIWEGKPATLNFLRDITIQRKMGQQLLLAQKMEAVGTLAGGVAHDFNNLLMAIQGRTSLMMIETDRFHASFEHLREIENIIQKAAKLTKQILGFARGGKYEIKPTDLNQLIENSAQMFGRTKKEISIFKKYEEKLWPAAVDQSQIDQVLLNIFVNAWQAMPEGGDLYLQTKNEILDENFARAHGMASGKFVKISIMDTGIGMDDQTIKRVFDPFFTTKEKERGTGLGLASAYGIIKNHDGIITVDGKPGKGATFNIYLPASEKNVNEELVFDPKISTGSETVLIVDDEAMILDVSVQLLKKMGYEVLTAPSGKDAIEIYKQNANRIAIVILDLIMPGMAGGEVYDRLKELDSNVKVLLSSGYSINGQAAEILNRGCDGFIQKPFKLNELSIKVREIINK